MLDINIWDEIGEDGSTYAYVETDGGLSNEVQKEMLETVHFYISEKIPSLKSSVNWVDHLELYPNLRKSPYGKLLPKRWELKLSPLDWNTLRILLETLNNDPKLDELSGYPVTFISES